MLILGIDPGIRITGYGIVQKRENVLKSVSYGEIRTIRADPLSQRLAKIYDELMQIMGKYKPDTISLENIFYGKNVKSLIRQGHVRGAIILTASHCRKPVYEYTPLEVKKSVVGYGRAEKTQVQQMVKAILSLSALPSEDASDALAIAICHANFMKAESI